MQNTHCRPLPHVVNPRLHESPDLCRSDGEREAYDELQKLQHVVAQTMSASGRYDGGVVHVESASERGYSKRKRKRERERQREKR